MHESRKSAPTRMRRLLRNTESRKRGVAIFFIAGSSTEGAFEPGALATTQYAGQRQTSAQPQRTRVAYRVLRSLGQVRFVVGRRCAAHALGLLRNYALGDHIGVAGIDV